MALSAVASISAQKDKKQQDREAILAMQGCYFVEFRYAEVYSPDSAYQFTEREKVSSYEWITPIVVEEDFISLQHLLTVNDSTVVKHWRQDWSFESPEYHAYLSDYTWEKTKSSKPAKGQWRQDVTQVDDSPRYSGLGTWVFVDGKKYWESEAHSPLPRRELKKKREDYNVLLRGNRHELTDYGWIHNQDNAKVVRDAAGNYEMIAREKGWNTYTKVDEAQCQPSIDYWNETSRFWSHVRDYWARTMAANDKFHVEVKNEHGILHMTMFSMAKESKDWSDKKMIKQIEKAINNHLVVNEDVLGKL